MMYTVVVRLLLCTFLLSLSRMSQLHGTLVHRFYIVSISAVIIAWIASRYTSLTVSCRSLLILNKGRHMCTNSWNSPIGWNRLMSKGNLCRVLRIAFFFRSPLFLKEYLLVIPRSCPLRIRLSLFYVCTGLSDFLLFIVRLRH